MKIIATEELYPCVIRAVKSLFGLLVLWGAVALPVAISQDARVQIIHNAADPAARTVDIYLDGSLTLDDFRFRQATPYIDIAEGEHVIAVAPSNSSTVSDAIADFTVNLQSGEIYTVIANGVLGSNFAENPGGTAFDIAFNLYVNDMARETGPSGKVALQVFHGATDAPPVAVRSGESTLIDSLGYGNYSGYLEIDPNVYTLDITPYNSENVVASFDADLTSLGGGSATVVASGFLTPQNNGGDGAMVDPFTLLAVLADGTVLDLGSARLQVIHNAADPAAATVDVYIDGALPEALDDFAFRSATPFIDLSSGYHEIAVAGSQSGSVEEALATFPVVIQPNGSYIVVANGVLSPEQFADNPDGRSTAFNLWIKESVREQGLDSGNVDFFAVHGSTDAPTVDIGARGVATLVNDAAYGDITGYLSVPADRYTLDIRLGNLFTTVASFEADLSSLGGGSAAVLASGFLASSSNQDGPAFGLIAVLADGTVIELPAVTKTARAQIIHNAADPAADSVDVYINNELALDNFKFRSASPYISLPAGEELTVAVAGSNSSSAEDAIASFPATLTEGETYAIIANGVLDPNNFAANPDGKDIGFTLLVKSMARESAMDTEKVEFYVVHGATDAPTVDVAVSGGPTLVEGAAYKDITGYLAVDPASYNLDIIPSGSSEAVAGFQADLTSLQGGTAAVLASGFLTPGNNQDGKPFGLIAVLADGTVIELPTASSTARVQIIHNAADPAADTVDVYVNEDLAIDNFAFRNATPYIDLPAGEELTIGVAGKNSGSYEDAIATFSVTLEKNETYAVIANGVLNPNNFAVNPDGKDIGFTLLVKTMARESAEDAEKVELYVVHGATDAPTVDVAVSGGPNLVEGAAYRDITGYLAVDPASYDLDIIPSGSSEAVASFQADLSSLQGGTAAVLASGFLTPGNNQDGKPFGLIAVLADGTVIELPVPTSVEDPQTGLPHSFDLKGNYPNPFNPSTQVVFDLPQTADVTLEVYNMLGQKMMTLDAGRIQGGSNQQIRLDASVLSSGVYIYRVIARTGNSMMMTGSGKMVLLK